MENRPKTILSKDFSIDGKYKIMFFIKQGHNAETYRVKGIDQKVYFLKLFNYSKLNRTAFDDENNLLEIEVIKQVKHENIVSYKDSGELIHEGKRYGYLVLDFIAGETLAERISREPFKTIYDVNQTILEVLQGLEYLHKANIIHNEITLQNIMLDLSGNLPKAKIIDFGYSRPFHSSTKTFCKDGLNLNLMASECFNNAFSPQSDIFSVGVMMYQLIFGLPPWYREVSQFQSDRNKAEELILETRKKPLSFTNISNDFVGYDDLIERILKKALCQDTEDRFENANEFIAALKKEIEVEDVDKFRKIKSGKHPTKKIQIERPKGKGFDAIAGMHELKEQLKTDVIDCLNNPEKYAEYGVTIPNGMLLYGPPRCGKTFFAKSLAEEVGINYMFCTASTLKSRYINATQENIAKLFVDAEKNAPTIIFIDEINELLPCRDSDSHEMAKSAVNEMLAQMDRTGEKGIFVIGATNYPNLIDPAMLGAGRLEKKYFIGTPDFEARKAMFEMHLKDRPLDFGINYEKLAQLTENYVSADIKDLIISDAARQALKSESRISMEILEEIIAKTKPSISKAELEKYDRIKTEIEGKQTVNTKFGF